jgi:hypothetical protein
VKLQLLLHVLSSVAPAAQKHHVEGDRRGHEYANTAIKSVKKSMTLSAGFQTMHPALK